MRNGNFFLILFIETLVLTAVVVLVACIYHVMGEY